MSLYSDRDYEELVHKYEALKISFDEYKNKHPVSGNGREPGDHPAPPVSSAPTEVAIPESREELEETLSRLVQRIAMIIQAEKCLLMLVDSDSGELVGLNPAFNIPQEDVAHVRVRATQGIAGEVFQSGQPIIVNDAMRDPRAEHDHVGLLNARNMIVLPLIREHRNRDGALVDKTSIGVLNVYNKRFGNEFSSEDITLLRVLARNTASIIQGSRLIERLQDEKKQLVQHIESVKAGILVISRAGQIRLVNQAARALFSLPEDCVHRMYTEVIEDERVRTLIDRSFSLRIEQSDEVVITYQAGEETLENVYQAQTGLEYEDNDLVGVVAIFTDITEIRNVDRMKTAFVSTVSHELRTPLTNIKGFITTLLCATEGEDETFSNEQVHEFYEIIDMECDRLTRLITDLLNVSRIEQGIALELNPSSVDLASLIDKVVTTQQASDKVGHDWVVQAPELEPIEADEDRLDQILTNLINNAVKYSPNGGIVGVRVRDDGDSVVISVSDQGMGMKPEFLAKNIFRKFARERYEDKQKIYGTGLGLYLVKHMVEAHAGKIWVESAYGRGSNFSVRLPKKQPREQG
ncbi:MAG TPA: ATP-binding protein [Armatimonadota bacterium]|nr:ATP-binding protein [Armatimonadota bacterium]